MFGWAFGEHGAAPFVGRFVDRREISRDLRADDQFR